MAKAETSGITTLDFSSIPSNEPLETGEYEFLIKKIEPKTSKAGNPMWLVTFEEVETKTVIWENYTFVDKALFKIKELFDVLGFDTTTIPFEIPALEDLVGNFVKGKVIQEEYEGRMQNRMKKLFV